MNERTTPHLVTDQPRVQIRQPRSNLRRRRRASAGYKERWNLFFRQFGLGTKVDAPGVNELHRPLVKAGDVWPGVQPSRIGIYSTSGGMTSVDLVREAVEYEASKPDNRSKLARAKADERHRFLWIDPATSPAAPASGFMDVSRPSARNLPPEINVAWIAIPTTDEDGPPFREAVAIRLPSRVAESSSRRGPACG